LKIQRDFAGDLYVDNVDEIKENGFQNSTERDRNERDNSTRKVELLLNYVNRNYEPYHVTTHDCILLIDGQKADNMRRAGAQFITTLRPNDSISLRAEAMTCTSSIIPFFEATTNVGGGVLKKDINDTNFAVRGLDTFDDTKHEIIFESKGQIDRVQIVLIACQIMKKRLENLCKYIEKKKLDIKQTSNTNTNTNTSTSKNKSIFVELYGETNALHIPITYELQSMDEVLQANSSMPNSGIRKAVIMYTIIPTTNPSEILLKACTKLINHLDKIHTDVKPYSIK
jgi:DNA-directed RNA polymerase subunit L